MPAIFIRFIVLVRKVIDLCYKKQWKLFYAGYVAAGILLLSAAVLLLLVVPNNRYKAAEKTVRELPVTMDAVYPADTAVTHKEATRKTEETTKVMAEEPTDKQTGTVQTKEQTIEASTAPQKAHWPLTGHIKTEFAWQFQPVYQEWRFHPGLDIERKDGEEKVKAMYDGKVIDLYTDPTTGLTLVVAHGADIIYYGSLASIQVDRGSSVRAGQEIAVPGLSVAEPFIHVHLVVNRDGKSINPLEFLR